MSILTSDGYLIIEISDISPGSSRQDAVTIREILNIEKDAECHQFYTDGILSKQSDEHGYNFVFLDQDWDELTKALQRLLSANQNKDVRIAVHNTGERSAAVSSLIDELKSVYPRLHSNAFSHLPNDQIWSDGLKPLLKSIGRNIDDYNRYFKALRYLIYSPLNEAERLRDQLLTPLVALYWLAEIPDNCSARCLRDEASQLFERERMTNLVKWRKLRFPNELFQIKNVGLDFQALKAFAKKIDERIEAMRKETDEG